MGNLENSTVYLKGKKNIFEVPTDLFVCNKFVGTEINFCR